MYQLFMYKSRKPKTQDIFSVDNLKAMCEFESTFTMKQKPDSECEPGIDANGNDVFFTVDAGPQIKAICLPSSADVVADALSKTPGVIKVIRSSLGDGARVLE